MYGYGLERDFFNWITLLHFVDEGIKINHQAYCEDSLESASMISGELCK